MIEKNRPIGVFDSGLGGISVLKELYRRMPLESYLYYGDSAFAPYGVKSKEEITKRCFEIVTYMIEREVKAIVIACNTATSACVKELRAAYPELIIIGMEPALKVAVHEKEQQSVVVMATDFTLREKKFDLLMKQYEEEHTIYKQPCPKLVELVEQNLLDEKDIVLKQLHEYLDHYQTKQVDSLVLGCTHFVFYKEALKEVMPHVSLIDGNEGTARHLEDLLMEKSWCQREEGFANITFVNSSNQEEQLRLCKSLFEKA